MPTIPNLNNKVNMMLVSRPNCCSLITALDTIKRNMSCCLNPSSAYTCYRSSTQHFFFCSTAVTTVTFFSDCLHLSLFLSLWVLKYGTNCKSPFITIHVLLCNKMIVLHISRLSLILDFIFVLICSRQIFYLCHSF